jgi:hypothetical protein
MADRFPYWIAEQSPYHRGPTAAGVLRLALVVVLVVLLLQAIPTTDSGGAGRPPPRPAPCARHFPPTCPEVTHGR